MDLVSTQKKCFCWVVILKMVFLVRFKLYFYQSDCGSACNKQLITFSIFCFINLL